MKRLSAGGVGFLWGVGSSGSKKVETGTGDKGEESGADGAEGGSPAGSRGKKRGHEESEGA